MTACQSILTPKYTILFLLKSIFETSFFKMGGFIRFDEYSPPEFPHKPLFWNCGRDEIVWSKKSKLLSKILLS